MSAPTTSAPQQSRMSVAVSPQDYDQLLAGHPIIDPIRGIVCTPDGIVRYHPRWVARRSFSTPSPSEAEVQGNAERLATALAAITHTRWIAILGEPEHITRLQVR